ncbi:MAG: MgtC/SapB family protein, partial [Desulfobacca sp.]|uniref:MgtC/SapB family protein n=1 Tax=Desulfobacca sp. TaxID=2067990 RepID=UPI004049DCD0
YAIASMGFLGAGAIISGKGTVKGLTTAASIWLVTGIGLALGAGFFLPALTCVVLSLLVLYGFRKIKKYLPRDTHSLLTLSFDRQQADLEAIKSYLGTQHFSINFINYYLNQEDQTLTYKLRLQSKMDIPWADVVQHFRELAGLRQISWEEGTVP